MKRPIDYSTKTVSMAWSEDYAIVKGTILKDGIPFIFAARRQHCNDLTYRGEVRAQASDGSRLKDSTGKQVKLPFTINPKSIYTLNELDTTIDKYLITQSDDRYDVKKLEHSPSSCKLLGKFGTLAIYSDKSVQDVCDIGIFHGGNYISIYSKVSVASEVENIIVNKTIRLYGNKATLIDKEWGHSFTPDTITLAAAACKYGRKYYSLALNTSNEDYITRHVNQLIHASALFPVGPMSEIDKKCADRVLKDLPYTVKNDLYDFWRYCKDIRKVSVYPPFSKVNNYKPKKSRNLDIVRELSMRQADNLVHDLSLSPRGYRAGMLIIIGAGCSIDDMLTHNWGDLSINQYGDLQIRDIKDDIPGPVHNFSRALIPQVEALKEEKNKLQAKYGAEVIAKWPICSQHDNPAKKITRKAFLSDVKAYLKRTVFSEADYNSICKSNPSCNTIERILRGIHSDYLCLCGIDKGSRLHTFLSAGSTTADSSFNYVSYTCEDARLMIHFYFNSLKDEVINDNQTQVYNSGDGQIHTVISPKTTWNKLQVTIAQQPGQTLMIKTRHGSIPIQ